MNEVSDNPDLKDEEGKNPSKNSTSSNDQNVVLNLMNKSRSQSNTQSNNRSSERHDNLSSLSDLRNNSMNEGRSQAHAKTEKSFSDNTANNDHGENMKNQYSPLIKQPKRSDSQRKDSESTLKTVNNREHRKFSEITAEIK